jgi:hypothetical protein
LRILAYWSAHEPDRPTSLIADLPGLRAEETRSVDGNTSTGSIDGDRAIAARQSTVSGTIHHANASLESHRSMQEYDLYFNPQKPAVGLYVRKGAGLPDLADPKEWLFDGTATQADLPADLVKRIQADGHAFRDMD